MSTLSRPLALAPRQVAGQPLIMVVSVVILWVGFRAFWLAFDGPAVRPPDAGLWSLPASFDEPVGASPHLSEAISLGHEPVRATRVVKASFHIKQTAPAGGRASASFDTWLRLAALGGQWTFASRPPSAGGWRAGNWRAGYRDPQIASTTTNIWTARATKDLPAIGAEAEPSSRIRAPSRWAASAWLLARPGSSVDSGRTIARYGASQAGAVIEYRLAGESAPRAYVRASRALVDGGEAEVAAGVKFAIADLPLAAHVERRFAVNAAGRDAMALFVSGGLAAGDASHVEIEGYGQAGVVGFRRKVPFIDAAVVARRRIAAHGPLSLSAGGGGWIGAQTGTSRVDVGPRIEAQYDDGVHGRLSLDWRERVGGSAQPRSGPAMTLALSF